MAVGPFAAWLVRPFKCGVASAAPKMTMSASPRGRARSHAATPRNVLRSLAITVSIGALSPGDRANPQRLDQFLTCSWPDAEPNGRSRSRLGRDLVNVGLTKAKRKLPPWA